MCRVCDERDFYSKLSPVQKSAVAIDSVGMRTIHGYYDAGDAAILATHYPKTGLRIIEAIAKRINHPRLLEVAGLVEVIERCLEGSYSQIKGMTLKFASNPLSLLFWSPRDNTVHRVKTRESELLHGAMEKMALRKKSLEEINGFIMMMCGLQITFGCSCCVIAIKATDLPALYASEYYDKREGLGRYFDSDVLTQSNTLFDGISVADIPPSILAASADFGQNEVLSYLRFAKATTDVLLKNPVTPSFELQLLEAKAFLLGEPNVQLAA